MKLWSGNDDTLQHDQLKWNERCDSTLVRDCQMHQEAAVVQLVEIFLITHDCLLTAATSWNIALHHSTYTIRFSMTCFFIYVCFLYWTGGQGHKSTDAIKLRRTAINIFNIMCNGQTFVLVVLMQPGVTHLHMLHRAFCHHWWTKYDPLAHRPQLFAELPLNKVLQFLESNGGLYLLRKETSVVL